ncbi:MAG: BamA/TamA family outer membrane protein [Nitratireductor sp.]|nr:BamA/TamA family outer membrane protein [Nitratireductor sp.]
MNSYFSGRIVLAAALAAVTLPAGMITSSGHAAAQAIDRYSQGLARKPARQVALTPVEPGEASGDTTPLVPSLRGVVIVNDPGSISRSGANAAGVEARGDMVPAPVVSAANGFLGNVVTMASLDSMTRALVLAYRASGMPVVNVVIPPQDISNGVIQVVAVVGRLGKLQVSGETATPDYYSQGFPLAAGDVVEEGAVLSHLRWKSRRLHRRVDAIYEPGAAFSETDITLQVTETKPWAVFGGVDNTGSKGGVGELRIFGGFTVADFGATDHEFSYQYTTSEDGPDALSAHVMSYILPVADWTDFQLTGAYVTTGVYDTDFASDGTSWQLGGTFITQLPRLHLMNWEARYGFEYKSSDNNLEFGGTPVTGNETEIGQFFIQMDGQRGDSRSATNVYAGVWYSPGDMFADNTDAAFAGTRPGATADYAYLRAGLEHTIFLPGDFRFVAAFDAQLADGRLLPSEEMYLGGMNTVRGFDENALQGDNGVLARVEFYTPGFSLFGESTASEDQLRFFGFYDIGTVTSNSPVDAATDIDGTLAGAGIGLTYQFRDNVSAEVAYGWQVEDSASVDLEDDGQLHFRFVARF